MLLDICWTMLHDDPKKARRRGAVWTSLEAISAVDNDVDAAKWGEFGRWLSGIRAGREWSRRQAALRPGSPSETTWQALESGVDRTGRLPRPMEQTLHIVARVLGLAPREVCERAPNIARCSRPDEEAGEVEPVSAPSGPSDGAGPLMDDAVVALHHLRAATERLRRIVDR